MKVDLGEFIRPLSSRLQGILGPKSLLSLSIEGTSVRLLACRGHSVVAWNSIFFNPKFLRGGFVADPEGLASVISNALKKEGLGRQRQVIASLPGLHSLSRVLELPATRDLRPELAIPQMARREMGFSPEGSSLYWRPVAGNRLRRRFFVFSAPKEPIAALVETLKLAGLRPAQIETRPFALARAVNQPEAIVVDVESNGLDIVIVRAGLPAVTQSAFLGEEAQEGEALAAVVHDTLERVVGSYNDANPDSPLHPSLPLYLVGASFSLHPDLVEATAGVLGHPPAQFNPPLLHPADFPKAELAVNIGLVLREL